MSVNNEVLDDIAEKIAGSMRMLGGVKQEAETQVRGIVEGALEHFDVVTHERMQVQETMLNRAREELVRLDARVKELEEKLKEHK